MRGVVWLVALLALMCAVVPARAGDEISAATIRQNLFSTCFRDEKHGWAVGDLGRIFRTADGGKTWERQVINAARSSVAITCPDDTHLWIAGQAGQILHSSDAGKSWQPQKSTTERQLLDIEFVTLQRGLAVGDYGTMLRTDDGGTTWTKVPLPTDTKLPPDVAEVVEPGDVVLYGVSFADADHVWVVGEFGVILASTDGGLTWHPQTSPVETSLFDVSFTDQQHGWAVGLESTLLVTTDGGTSWATLPVDTPKGFNLALYDVQVRGNYGWAVGTSGLLLNSKDGGRTWQLVSVPVQMRGSWLRGISLLPDGRGFIVGARGLVLAADRDSFTSLKPRF